MGGWILTNTKPTYLGKIARFPDMTDLLIEQPESFSAKNTDFEFDGEDFCITDSNTILNSEKPICIRQTKSTVVPEAERILNEIGYFTEITPEDFVFDENKYSQLKRQLAPADWDATTRHLPIKIDPTVINKPGERSPEALRQVVAYTTFDTPRYVATRGERVTMCNIAAWDWSRALRVHLPHWIGETEMSANMLFRWISHPQAGGIYGEGWQPVSRRAAQLLADLGVPVFALAENSVPGRHGHVALVYPKKQLEGEKQSGDGLYFASVNNGRSRSGNGIKSFGNTFRRLKPTYFVHKSDFVVYQDS
jgi:hypothetical protein